MGRKTDAEIIRNMRAAIEKIEAYQARMHAVIKRIKAKMRRTREQGA
jgi:hypothetical protein